MQIHNCRIISWKSFERFQPAQLNITETHEYRRNYGKG